MEDLKYATFLSGPIQYELSERKYNTIEANDAFVKMRPDLNTTYICMQVCT